MRGCSLRFWKRFQVGRRLMPMVMKFAHNKSRTRMARRKTGVWPRLAEVWRAVIFAVDAQEYGRLAAFGPVETVPLFSCSSVLRVRPAFPQSCELFWAEIEPFRLVQLARSEARCYMQRVDIDGHHVAAHRGLQATWLQTDLRMLAAGGGWCQSGPLVSFSCASSIPPQPEAPFFTLADRIFWKKIKDEVDPLRPFRLADSQSRLWSSFSGPPMSARCFPPSAALLLGLVLLP